MLYSYSNSTEFIIPQIEQQEQKIEKPQVEVTFSIPQENNTVQHKAPAIQSNPVIQDNPTVQNNPAINKKPSNLITKPINWIEHLKQVFAPNPSDRELYRELSKVSREIETCRASQ